MADILIKCNACGAETKVSEYASSGAVACSACGAQLNLPNSGKTASRLQVRKIDAHQRATLTDREPATTAAEDRDRAQSAAKAEEVLKGVHKIREKVKRPSSIWGWLIFLAVAGGLIGAQYVIKDNALVAQYYPMTRDVSAAIASVLVILVAFQDGTGQGLLSLFVPFYILYYAFVRLDSYWIRGLFAAVYLALGTELYFMPSEARIVSAQKTVSQGIENVGRLVQRASDAPDMPAPKVRHRRSQSNVSR